MDLDLIISGIMWWS